MTTKYQAAMFFGNENFIEQLRDAIEYSNLHDNGIPHIDTDSESMVIINYEQERKTQIMLWHKKDKTLVDNGGKLRDVVPASSSSGVKPAAPSERNITEV